MTLLFASYLFVLAERATAGEPLNDTNYLITLLPRICSVTPNSPNDTFNKNGDYTTIEVERQSLAPGANHAFLIDPYFK